MPEANPLPPVPQLPQADWWYTERFLRAFDAAARMHAAQVRKGSRTPYILHLMAVSSIVLEHGGNEDQAIAALLHDALEDVRPTEEARAVVAGFGPEVLRIVEACTDGTPDADGHKAPWRFRKDRYVDHLGAADAAVLLVAGADKLHNTRSMTADLRSVGDALWSRFNAPEEDILWYHRRLVEVMSANPAMHPGLLGALAREVADLHVIAGET